MRRLKASNQKTNCNVRHEFNLRSHNWAYRNVFTLHMPSWLCYEFGSSNLEICPALKIKPKPDLALLIFFLYLISSCHILSGLIFKIISKLSINIWGYWAVQFTFIFKLNLLNQAWWYKPLILAIRKQKQADLYS